MNTYKFEVVETVKKIVEVEANSREEAEQMAAEEDMSKNYDDYNLEVKFLKETAPDNQYPVCTGKWQLVYSENLTYVKELKGGRYRAICAYHLEDDDDDTDPDMWVALCADGDTCDEALEALDIMPFPTSDVMSWEDLKYTILRYIEED